MVARQTSADAGTPQTGFAEAPVGGRGLPRQWRAAKGWVLRFAVLGAWRSTRPAWCFQVFRWAAERLQLRQTAGGAASSWLEAHPGRAQLEGKVATSSGAAAHDLTEQGSTGGSTP